MTHVLFINKSKIIQYFAFAYVRCYNILIIDDKNLYIARVNTWTYAEDGECSMMPDVVAAILH